MRAFGAVGYVSQEQLNRTNAFLAECRRADDLKKRDQIARLSDRDITIMAADVVVTAVPLRGSVGDLDYSNVGLPLKRVRALKDQIMAAARIKEPRIDAMLAGAML